MSISERCKKKRKLDSSSQFEEFKDEEPEVVSNEKQILANNNRRLGAYILFQQERDLAREGLERILTENRQQCKQQLDNLRQKYEAEVSLLQKEKTTFMSSNEKLTFELNTLYQENESNAEALKQALEERDHWKSKAEALNDQYNKVRNDYETLSHEMDELSRQNVELQSVFNQLNQECEGIREENIESKQKLALVENGYDQIREELEALNQKYTEEVASHEKSLLSASQDRLRSEEEVRSGIRKQMQNLMQKRIDDIKRVHENALVDLHEKYQKDVKQWETTCQDLEEKWEESDNQLAALEKNHIEDARQLSKERAARTALELEVKKLQEHINEKAGEWSTERMELSKLLRSTQCLFFYCCFLLLLFFIV